MNFLKVFINVFAKYLLSFTMVFTASLLIFFVAKGNIKDYILNHSRARVETGIQAVADSVDKMELTSYILYQSNDFISLKQTADTHLSQNTLQLRDVFERLSYIQSVTHHPSYVYALFSKNDYFLSNSQCHLSFTEYYGQHFSVALNGEEITDPMELKTSLFSCIDRGQKFLALDQITFTLSNIRQSLSEAVLYLTSGSITYKDNKQLFCFVLSKEFFLDAILSSEHMQNGFLCIQDISSQQELLSYGQVVPPQWDSAADAEWMEADNYFFTRLEDPQLNWMVTVGIPSAYVNQQISSAENVLFLYLLLGLLATLLLTLYFSFSNYRGFKRAINCIPAGEIIQPNSRHKNFYELLSYNITELNSKKQSYLQKSNALAIQNRAIQLENLVTRGCRNEQEYQIFKEFFEKEPEFYCVILVRFLSLLHKADSTAAELYMVEVLHKQELSVLFNIHSGISDTIFLVELPTSQESSNISLANTFYDIATEVSEKYNCILHIGISSIGVGLSNISKCYMQTERLVQAMYMHENKNMVQTDSSHSGYSSQNPLTIDFLNRLHTTLVNGRYIDAEKELNHLEYIYKRMPYIYESQKEQIFYSLANLFYSAIQYLNCESFDGYIPTFNSSMTSTQMISFFKDSSVLLCNYLVQNKKSLSEELTEKIMKLINENYMDPNLSAYHVCKEVGIAESYLGRFFKNQTGESFVTYLLHVRIEKAKEYLLQTDHNNAKIAELTGFSSETTFYRNFQKIVGISPKGYREQVKKKVE